MFLKRRVMADAVINNFYDVGKAGKGSVCAAAEFITRGNESFVVFSSSNTVPVA